MGFSQSRMPDRDSEAFDAAVAVVTCILDDDMYQARCITFRNDTLHPEMILMLARALADGNTPESWRQSLMTAHWEDGS
jgi:hypothetical protein